MAKYFLHIYIKKLMAIVAQLEKVNLKEYATENLYVENFEYQIQD